MAITPTAYATAEEYRAVVGKNDTSADTQITADLTAISRYLDNRLERFFGRDSQAVARVYIPPRVSRTLTVDDISADDPVTIKIDEDEDGGFEVTLAATDYELWPLNADKNPEARPFTQIHLPEWSNKACFRPDERVEVTARFGWAAVPAAIKQGTIQLTAIWRLETPRATRRIPELGEAIEASPIATGIVNRLIEQYWRPR